MTDTKTAQPSPPDEGRAAQPGSTWKPNRLINDLAEAWGIEPSRVPAFIASFIAVKPAGTKVPYDRVLEFALICHAHKLNPATKEIYGFYGYNDQQGWKLQTGLEIDGWLKLMNNHPMADGFKVEYRYDPALAKDGSCTSCVGKFYRKDRKHPVEIELYMAEWYDGKSPVWREKEKWQLYVKTVKHGARFTYGFSGIGDLDREEIIQAIATVKDQPALEDKTITGDIVSELNMRAATPKAQALPAVAVPEPKREAPPPQPEPEAEQQPEDDDEQEPEGSHDVREYIEDPDARGEEEPEDDEPEPTPPPAKAAEPAKPPVEGKGAAKAKEGPKTESSPYTPRHAVEFGQWLKAQRRAKGMTIGKVLEKARMEPMEYGALESGNLETFKKLTQPQINALGEALGDPAKCWELSARKKG